MAIRCKQCKKVFPNSTVVMKRGCMCGSKVLEEVSNPFAPDRAEPQVQIIKPEVKPAPVATQPPIKKPTEE